MERVAVILCSHGPFAQAAAESMEMIIGVQENYAVVSVTTESTLKSTRESLANCLNSLNRSNGVLVLADIFGGTPSNAAGVLCLTEKDVAVLAGFHLPLLIELFTNQTMPLAELVAHLEQIHCSSLINVNREFSEKGGSDDERLHQDL